MGRSCQRQLGGKIITKMGKVMRVQAVILQLFEINVVVGPVHMAQGRIVGGIAPTVGFAGKKRDTLPWPRE